MTIEKGNHSYKTYLRGKKFEPQRIPQKELNFET